MGYRTTTAVRMRKAALERLRQLSRQQNVDMVDLLDLAVVLLEIEVAKPAATREVLPVEAAEASWPRTLEFFASTLKGAGVSR